MIINLYAIYDKKAKCYTSPWTAVNNAAAIRSFSDTLKAQRDVPSMYQSHPEDFDLYYLGFMDDTIGLLEGVDYSKSKAGVPYKSYLCSLTDFLVKEENPSK